MADYQNLGALIWSIAELLRGDYKQHDNGKVILPLAVLRRLECVLEPTREDVRLTAAGLKAKGLKDEAAARVLNKVAGHDFHNTSLLYFGQPRPGRDGKDIPGSLLADPDKIAENLTHYIQSFSPNARAILEHFKFEDQIAALNKANLLFMVVKRFCEVDLHPTRVPNHAMGGIFEELIRKFAEQSNETAGEHFTPREVIRLMVTVLFAEDKDALTKKGIVRKLYDPACGTGGMLSVAEEYLRALNPDANLLVFGQELNPEAYAICNSDMLIKGQDVDRVVFGNTFSQDGHRGETFDYMLSNPPFGVDWKKNHKEVTDEHNKQGFNGRFGPGLPRISDGSLLFLLHMISKMAPITDSHPEGARIGIVLNGSPLFSGDAGSGESDIRRWIIEQDYLEAIIGLPDQLFFNTGIYTYIWVVTNRKAPRRQGKVLLVNATGMCEKMRKSLGNKRHFIPSKQIEDIARLYAGAKPGPGVRVFDNEDFGYRQITAERPLRLNFLNDQSRRDSFHATDEWQAVCAKDPEAAAVLRAGISKVEPNRQLAVRDALDVGFGKLFAKAKLKAHGPLYKELIRCLSERDPAAEPFLDFVKGEWIPVPDSALRDTENVPLKEDIHEWFAREVTPFRPDAWIDEAKTKIGYEIPFTRHFYEYTPLPPLEEIDAEIRKLETDILAMLKTVMA